ncbi:hypothetical protein IWW48_000418 [Coemansia sp. RSA 1200]|nr:hypothetical protein IWW48_000418 [Coemansia sp. RSA 1200]
MDRKIALPSFREVAGALHSPTLAHSTGSVTVNSVGPRPIPFERSTNKSPSGPHSLMGARYSIHSESSGATVYNNTGSDAASTYQQQQQQQRYLATQPSSYPGQTVTSSTFLSRSPPAIRSHEQHQTASAYDMHKGNAISPHNGSVAHQSQLHSNNVFRVAQVTTDPIMQQQSSFMHSPPSSASSRFAPYHMPSSYSLPTASAAGGLVRTSASPKSRHDALGSNSGDFSVSRAATAISSVALSSPISPTTPAPLATAAPRKQRTALLAKSVPSPFQQNGQLQQQPQPQSRQQRRTSLNSNSPRYGGVALTGPGGPIMAPSSSEVSGSSVAPIIIPRPPPMLGHSPPSPPVMPGMNLTQQRMGHHSLPEHIEHDDADDILDCYDDASQTHGADGTVMTTAKIRTIHKLAERRRRREMKNLFDTLRKCLPIDKSIRLSKWEVLKKAIEVISAQETEIHMLRLHIDTTKNTVYKESVK